MAKGMKAVAALAKEPATLTVKVDPLPLARGATKVRRGGLHAMARHAGRAAAKRVWRRERDGLLV